jgi:ankyrin repeat protein
MPTAIDFDFVAAVRNGSIESALSELLQGAAPTGKNLSKLGIDPNSVDPDGNTLMHVACSTGNLESAIYLRKVGSDVNRFNDVGYTPLCCCILKAKSMGMINGKDVATFIVV